MSHVPIYLSVMHIKLSLHTLAAIILCGLISDLLPYFKLLWGLTYPQLWFMARHVSEVCGAYIYMEYRIYQCKCRRAQLPYAHTFVLLLSRCSSRFFAYSVINWSWYLHSCVFAKHPQVQFISHVFAIFPIPQLQIYVLTWLHSLKQAGVFVCCSQLQEYADRVWNSREACLKSQFTTTGSKTVKSSWILQLVFVICCFYDCSSILNCLFVSILKKYILTENRFELKKQKYKRKRKLWVGLNNRDVRSMQKRRKKKKTAAQQ